MMQLTENLYVFEDTCNVYALRSGREAVLVDFGAGHILEELSTIGVDHVTDVLMTHHHRDQGQGLARAIQEGARVWVPHVEQDLFHSVDLHWQAREVVENVNMRQDRFSLLEPVSIAGTLTDYRAYQFGAHRILVVPTPGHTLGSISVLAEIDGQHVAFTGDLMTAPGKVWSLAATQWTTNGVDGVIPTILSLLDLKDRDPELLLPSHGQPIQEPSAAIDLLVDRLKDLVALHRDRLVQAPALRRDGLQFTLMREEPYDHLTPHLLHNWTCVGYSYVLLSESGKALVIDYGFDGATGWAPGADRASRRPWLYTVGVLKRTYGVTEIDVVIPTHYHEDHVAALILLRDVEGTQVWAPANFADVLVRPSRYDLPAIWYDPIPVDRVLPLGAPVRWEEYALTPYELPGHTLYAAAIAFDVDGKRVVAVGDQQDNTGWPNYGYQMRFRIDDYVTTADLYQRLKPDLILSGHWDPLWVTPEFLSAVREKGQTLARLHRELLPLEDVDFGAEGVGAWIRPYQVETRGGATVDLEVDVRNPYAVQSEASVHLVVPAGWQANPGEALIAIPAHASGTIPFRLAIPPGVTARRARVAADVTVGRRRFGQQAEALVTVR